MANEPRSEQSERDSKGRLLPGHTANPKGKGGFGEHPENRSDGRWNGRSSINYNLSKYKAMTDSEIEEVKEHLDELTQAEKIALKAVLGAEVDTEFGFRKYQDLVDRTEGRPRQTIDANLSQAEPPQITVKFK